MVNIDGVILGNYRGNFAGFDLNRCWLKTDPNKQP
jgi:murein tripeptide amidase MpaA